MNKFKAIICSVLLYIVLIVTISVIGGIQNYNVPADSIYRLTSMGLVALAPFKFYDWLAK